MIPLFKLPEYELKSTDFTHILHDPIVTRFEERFAEYVGAKYACGASSATNLIMLSVIRSGIGKVSIPTMIPPVVANGISTAGAEVEFYDDPDWVGHSYKLYEHGDYKVVDSAQRVDQGQFKKECNPQDLMFFSFYPTKPIGSIDGGIIVSDDKEKIEWFRAAVFNGMSFSTNNWERKLIFPGWKMYLNSIQARVANDSLSQLEAKKARLSEIRDFYNLSFGYNNSSSHLYRVKVGDNSSVMELLKTKGITTGIHYTCLHKSNVFNKDYSLPKSESLEGKTLTIPFNEALDDKQVELIIKNVKPFIL